MLSVNGSQGSRYWAAPTCERIAEYTTASTALPEARPGPWPPMTDEAPQTWAEKHMQDIVDRDRRRQMARELGRAGGRKGGPVTAARRRAKDRITMACKAGLASWAARRANPAKMAAWRAACVEGQRRKVALRKALLDLEKGISEP